MGSLLLYGLAMWLVILVLAVLNGTARDLLYKNKVGELRAHQISTFTLIALIFAATYLFLRLAPPASSTAEYWYLGLIWLAMTVAFEFLFFHYAAGHPWSELLENYDVLKGRIWILVLLATFIAPRLMSLLL